MKKLIGVAIVAVLTIGIIAGYSIFSGNLREGADNQRRTVEVAGFRIEVQRSYLFEEWTIDFDGKKVLSSKGLLIELRLKNIADRTKTISKSSFYIRDSQGRIYKELNLFQEWRYQYGLKQIPLGWWSYLNLEPEESSDLKLYLMKEQLWLVERKFDFPKDMTGLKLIIKDYITGEIQTTIPLEVKVKEAPAEATPRIKVQKAYIFEGWGENLYGKKVLVQRGLLIELKVENTEDTITGLACGDFYIKDARGKIYEKLTVFTDWEYTYGGQKRVPLFGILYLELKPGKSSDLKVYLPKELYDALSGVLLYSTSHFPESLKGLTLIYKDLQREIQATIPAP